MTEIATHRRRWPRVAVAVLLLPVGGLLAWRFRPLNSAEKAFVGQWHNSNSEIYGVRFYADHSWAGKEIGGITGVWSAQGNTLSMRPRMAFKDYRNLPWRMGVSRYFQTLISPPSGKVKWDGANHFFWQGNEYVRDPE